MLRGKKVSMVSHCNQQGKGDVRSIKQEHEVCLQTTSQSTAEGRGIAGDS